MQGAIYFSIRSKIWGLGGTYVVDGACCKKDEMGDIDHDKMSAILSAVTVVKN